MDRTLTTGVALINYNNPTDTLECVAYITDRPDPSILVVILDNGCQSGMRLSDQMLPSWTLEKTSHMSIASELLQLSLYRVPGDCLVLVAESKTNLGFCLGNNVLCQIIKGSGADLTLVLNNDARISSQQIQRLMESKLATGAFAISPIIDDSTRGKLWYGGGQYSRTGYSYEKRIQAETPYETQVYSGCCVLFRADDYLRLGGMNSSFFICIDEPEFSRRIRLAGGSIFVEPRVRIDHKVGQSVGRNGSLIHDYFWIRNRFLFSQEINSKPLHIGFILLYGSFRLFRWLQYAVQGVPHRIRHEIAAIADYSRGRLGPGRLADQLNAPRSFDSYWNGCEAQ